jgi:hypothetical protein
VFYRCPTAILAHHLNGRNYHTHRQQKRYVFLVRFIKTHRDRRGIAPLYGGEYRQEYGVTSKNIFVISVKSAAGSRKLHGTFLHAVRYIFQRIKKQSIKTSFGNFNSKIINNNNNLLSSYYYLSAKIK